MSSRIAYAAVVESLLNRSRAEENAEPTEEAARADAQLREREARVPEIAERLQQAFTDGVLNRLVLHDDKPIENLPTMTALELQLIGRCVSFGVKQSINGVSALYYYVGVVSAVTATAVTLLYVSRYTETDFKAYKEREKSSTTTSGHRDFHEKDGAAQMLVLAVGDGVTGSGGTAEREADVSHFPYSLSDVWGSAFGTAARTPVDVRGSLCPAVAMVTGTALKGLAAHHHHHQDDQENRPDGATHTPAATAQATPAAPGATTQPRFTSLRTCGASMGPLPYVTFLRKSIHDVRFGRDPRSSFYALFQDPSKQLMDMQYLRMFVRRYLVHTSAGNNTDQIPLCTYLTESGECRDLDRNLVHQLVREELQELMKWDRTIAKEKKRMRIREARREATLREYHAPPGLFADTGFLYLTGLPQGTALTAVTTLFFACAFAGNYLLPVEFAGEDLIRFFFDEINSTFMAALLMWVVTSFVALFHAFVMRVPSLANSPVLVLRGLSCVGSGFYAILCIVLITHCTTNDYLLQRMKVSQSDDLCTFYNAHRCSGFYAGCSHYPRSDPLCSPCMPVWYPDSSCYSAITDQLQRVMIPLFLFAIVIFLSAIHSLFLLLKLFLIGRSVSITSRN